MRKVAAFYPVLSQSDHCPSRTLLPTKTFRWGQNKEAILHRQAAVHENRLLDDWMNAGTPVLRRTSSLFPMLVVEPGVPLRAFCTGHWRWHKKIHDSLLDHASSRCGVGRRLDDWVVGGMA